MCQYVKERCALFWGLVAVGRDHLPTAFGYNSEPFLLYGWRASFAAHQLHFFIYLIVVLFS